MTSAEPAEKGIIDVFKFAANALEDAPSLDYGVPSNTAPASCSNEKGSTEIPALSGSNTYSSETYSHGSSSFGSSYDDDDDDETSNGAYRMEYHAFGNHSFDTYGSKLYDDDDTEQEDEDDSASGLGGISEAGETQDVEGKASVSQNTFFRLADALFMPTEPRKPTDIDNLESEDGEVRKPEPETSTHSRLGRIADTFFASKTSKEPVKSSAKAVADFEAIEVTAEESFRNKRTISSDIKVPENVDHRGHRRHASLPFSSDTTPAEDKVPSDIGEVQSPSTSRSFHIVPTEAAKSTKMQPGKPPLKVTPRSARSQTRTQMPVSMTEVGKPPLEPDQQKRISLFTFRSKSGSSPKPTVLPSPRGGGSSHSSPKSCEIAKANATKQIRFAESKEFQVASTSKDDLYVTEEREPVESEQRSSSERLGRSTSAPIDDSTWWQLGSAVPSAPPRSTIVAYTEPERDAVQEEESAPRVQEEEFQLFKVTRESREINLQKEQSVPSTPTMNEDAPIAPQSAQEILEELSKDTTANEKINLTKQKQRFSKLFLSPSKHEHEEKHLEQNAVDANTTQLGMTQNPVEPSSAKEAAEMITSLFKMSLQAGEEDPTDEPSQSKDIKTASTESVIKEDIKTTNADEIQKKPKKSSDADTTLTKNSFTKKKHRLFKFFRTPSKHEREEKHQVPETVETSKLATKEVLKVEGAEKHRVPNKPADISKSGATENPLEPSTATEAVEMLSNLFQMSFHALENPAEPSEKQGTRTSTSKISDTPVNSKESNNAKERKKTPVSDASASTTESSMVEDIKKRKKTKILGIYKKTSVASTTNTEESSSLEADKKNVKERARSLSRHARSWSHKSFFHSSKKEVKKAAQVPRKAEPTKNKKEEVQVATQSTVEENPADILDLTNWLWSPFLFPTNDSGVEPKDEPIVVVMDDDEVMSDKRKKNIKKILKSWTKRGKSSKSSELRSSSEDRQEVKKKKKQQSKLFVATRAAKDSSQRQQKSVEDNTVIIQDHHDNFVPSTSTWSQSPAPPNLPKEKRSSSKSGKSLKSRFLARGGRSGKKIKMEEANMDSGDINIVSFVHPKGKGQELMLMTESVSKKLKKTKKSHSALVKSLYGTDDSVALG